MTLAALFGLFAVYVLVIGAAQAAGRQRQRNP